MCTYMYVRVCTCLMFVWDACVRVATADNPLAGGLLTGRYKPSDVETHPTGTYLSSMY